MSTAVQNQSAAIDNASDADLPEGWAQSLVGGLLTFKYGKSLREDRRKDGPVRVYGSNGVVGHHDSSLTQGPAIIVGRKGSVGEVHFSQGACWPIDTTYFIDSFGGLEPKFVFYSLKSLALSELEKSSAIPGLSRDDAYEKIFSIAPRLEQKRIVTKIEDLLARIHASQECLSKVALILGRLRQSILAAACLGRLTANWRDEHHDVEPACELITRIRAECKRENPGDVELDLPEIPETWAWSRFGFLIGELRNGISTRPNIDPPGTKILRISSVRSCSVLFDDVRYLPKADDLIPIYKLRNDDLLFTRYNGSLELLRVCGMVRELSEGPLLYPDKLMRVRFDHPHVLPGFIEIFFQSPHARERLTEKSKSSAGQQGVSGADLKAQLIALPPVEEQREIVRRVEALFKLADVIEKRVEVATKRADKLIQAILAKAFRGELVPTEAELARREGRAYEPASVLLERIRVERDRKEAAASTIRHRRRLPEGPPARL